MKKKYLMCSYWLVVSLLITLSWCITSCKDDGKDDLQEEAKTEMSEEELAQDPYGKQTEAAMTLLRIVSQLTETSELPNDWAKATFEPSNGFVGDDGNPYSRTQSVSGAADAARRFNSLTGADIDSTTTSYTWKYDGVGTMTYRQVSDAGQVAVVDVDLQQMPHLKRIVYAKDLGLNGSWSGTPYYRLGDVIQDKDGSYWVCVRSAWAYSKKEDCHWISTSELPEKNLVYYNKGKDDELCLPTGLGNSTVHMRNFVDFFFAILWPEEYANMQQMNQLQVKKGLGDIDYVYHSKYYMKNVRYFYTKYNLWQNIFKFDKEMIEYAALDDLKSRYTPLRLYYNGYIMAGLSSQTGCYMRSYSGNGWQEESSDKEDKRRFAKSGGRKFSIQTLAKYGYGYSPVESASNSTRAYVVRYKTGEQLAKDNGNGKYNKQMAIPGVTEIYRYNAQEELGLPADYLTQDVKPVEESVADENDYVYGNYFDLLDMKIDGKCVIKNDHKIQFKVRNRGMKITDAMLHVVAVKANSGSEEVIEHGKKINISQNQEQTFNYTWSTLFAGNYTIRAWVDRGKDTLSTAINISNPDCSAGMIEISTDLPEYIKLADLYDDEPFKLYATNHNDYRVGTLAYTVFLYEGDQLINTKSWDMTLLAKDDVATFVPDLQAKKKTFRTIKVTNALPGAADADTVFTYTVGIDVPHTAKITCDNPYPYAGEKMNFTIQVTSHGSSVSGDHFSAKYSSYTPEKDVKNVDVDKRYEGFTGSDGETKNYYFEQSIYGNSTYQILFFDGDADCIGRYGGYSCDKYFDGSLDAYFQNIHVYANETFQVHYTVYSELGRSGKVELTGDQLFSATSEEINVRRGGVYHGYFEFTAPSVSKKQEKMRYTVQLRDKKSGKMLHYPMTIVVYHKPVETNTDQ